LINRRREKSPNDEDLTGVDDARFYFIPLGRIPAMPLINFMFAGKFFTSAFTG
jgi:hypothetical protein